MHDKHIPIVIYNRMPAANCFDCQRHSRNPSVQIMIKTKSTQYSRGNHGGKV
jgi:hypothetical protein